MKTLKPVLCLVLGLTFCLGSLSADPSVPSPRMKSYSWMSLSRWYAMHSEDVALADTGEAKLVFWGDSITEGWQGRGKAAWETHFAPLGAVNFGIGGDKTENLLWRLENGSTGKLDPERVVLLIGTNNFGLSDEAPIDVAGGVIAVVSNLRKSYPGADILLMALFPRSELPDSPYREKIRIVNSLIRPLGELEKVTYLDIGERFLTPEGKLTKDLMPDFLHLSEKSYAIWAEAILAWMDE